MSARVTWDGLTELRAWMRTMPARYAERAAAIITEEAAAAKAEVAAGYAAHSKSGDLADHLTLGKGANVGRFGASTILKNNAKIAFIFENGSQARHYYTKNGVKHLTGPMPGGHVFVPVVARHKAAMHERLIAMMREDGLQVTGDV